MEVTLALIIASIVDVPSIISIIGAVKAKKLWHIIPIALVSFTFSVVLSCTFGTFCGSPHPFIGLSAQLFIALIMFFIAEGIRKRNSDNLYLANKKVSIFLFVTLLIFGFLFSLIVYSAFQKGESFTKIDNLEYRAESKATPLTARTEEQVGFGIIPDPMEMNTESGQPTYTAKRMHDDVLNDEEILLYRQPIEIYWNDWRGKILSGEKVYILGEGKTVNFNGILYLSCQNTPRHYWITANNNNQSRLDDFELKQIVPAQVISVAQAKFCHLTK